MKGGKRHPAWGKTRNGITCGIVGWILFLLFREKMFYRDHKKWARDMKWGS